MRPGSTGSSPRTHTFAAAADLADADGLKASVPTALTAQSYDGADLDGALGPGPIALDPPRYPSVSTTADAATYNTTDPVVFTGTRGGLPATVSITLTQAGGNETVIADEPLDSLETIDVPAQLTVDGAFTFGWSGIGCRKHAAVEHPFRQVRAIGAGNLHVGFIGDTEDTFPMADGEKDAIEVRRIHATNTTCGVKIYE